MKFQTKTVLSGGNVAGNLTSSVMNLQNNYGYAAQVTFTGTPTGTVLIEGSNDSVNWSIVASLMVVGTNTLADNKDGIYWPFIRASKSAGGTGTMTVIITIKGA